MATESSRKAAPSPPVSTPERRVKLVPVTKADALNVPSREIHGSAARTCLIQTGARDVGGGNIVLMHEIDLPVRVNRKHWADSVLPIDFKARCWI